MRVVLFEPDIPQNAGTIIRTCAGFGVPCDLIEPLGFVLSDRHFRRAGMDYLDRAAIRRHASWSAFQAARLPGERLILLTTRAEAGYTRFAFQPDDLLLFGRESGGVPEEVHRLADARLKIPLQPGCRSLNVAVASAIVLAEALRQVDQLPAG